ncbi:hypothetical protein FTX61_21075 [Nitriliruptoraceae bacterium ZYF776]|nr:hypothetical protein [Profundirhabdus halotolerans]
MPLSCVHRPTRATAASPAGGAYRRSTVAGPGTRSRCTDAGHVTPGRTPPVAWSRDRGSGRDAPRTVLLPIPTRTRPDPRRNTHMSTFSKLRRSTVALAGAAALALGAAACAEDDTTTDDTTTDGAVDDGAVDDGAMDDGAMDDGAMDDGELDNG